MNEFKSWQLVGALALAGLFSGSVLAGVYIVTKPQIEKNRAEALERAILKVLPNATSFKPMVKQGAGSTSAKSTEAAEASAKTPERVYAGFDAGGNMLGYAIASTGPGFQDSIALLFGYDPAQKHIVGMQVLESRETPGLGDKIIADAAFLKNFEALAVEPVIAAVKHGTKSSANEVDCITGATISSKAVVAILNRGADRWADVLNRKQVEDAP